jgi:DNA-binding response OmpR family regulator
VPIIALSADATVECRTASIDAGCDLYVPKPFDADALANTIRALRDGRPRAPRDGDVASGLESAEGI